MERGLTKLLNDYSAEHGTKALAVLLKAKIPTARIFVCEHLYGHETTMRGGLAKTKGQKYLFGCESCVEMFYMGFLPTGLREVREDGEVDWAQ